MARPMHILKYINIINQRYSDKPAARYNTQQYLPQPKPSQPKADQYKEYLKAEPFLEPESQMFARDQLGFDEGGQVIGKPGGLVEPGVTHYATLTEVGKPIISSEQPSLIKKAEKIFHIAFLLLHYYTQSFF